MKCRSNQCYTLQNLFAIINDYNRETTTYVTLQSTFHGHNEWTKEQMTRNYADEDDDYDENEQQTCELQNVL